MSIPKPIDDFGVHMKPVRMMHGCVLFRSRMTCVYYLYTPLRNGLLGYPSYAQALFMFEYAAYRCMQARRAVHHLMRRESRMWHAGWEVAGNCVPNNTLWLRMRNAVPKHAH